MLRERTKERLKGIIIGSIATLLLTLYVPALANAITTTIQVTYRSIAVNVNGKNIITEQEPFIFEGRTYLAVRDIAEAFNSEIKMNESTNTIEITSRQSVQSTSIANPNQRPSNPTITRKDAEEIALNWLEQNRISGAWRDGGISMDFERNRWVWEVEFENRTHEWDFYIDVDTGEIIHVDIDKD